MPAQSQHATFAAPKHPVLLCVTILLVFVLWVLFVSTTNPHELLTGFFSAFATLVFTVFVCRSGSSNLQLRPHDLLQLLRIPWYILQDSFVILRVLFKDLLHLAPAGDHYRVCGFDGSSHDPIRVARMVLAVASATATPNSIVLGIDPSQSKMLFHQVEPTPMSTMTRALGAKS